MATTHTHVSIGGNAVDDDVLDIDIWYSKTTGMARCRVVISNVADKWGSTFNPNDAITVIIDPDPGAPGVMFVGFVDNVKPFLGRRGVLTNNLEVTGRNHGRYLEDYYHTHNYKEQESGITIDEILLALGDPLTYVDPGGTPAVKYNCLRTKLGTALMDISQLVGYDFYIDTAGVLHYFPAGSDDSGVDLICLPGDATNNLLAFEEYEQIGSDIKNTIEIHAGSVKDHWTEENATDYGVVAGAGAIVDETTTFFMFGAGSIQIVDLGANDVTVGLDFSGILYSYTNLDLTKYGQAKVVFRPEDASTGSFDFRPVLIDSSARQITFTRRREGKSSKGYTENLVASRETWHPLSFPIGEHDENEIQAAVKSGYWHGDTAFDWGDVSIVGFQLVTGAGMDTVFFDALYIPSIQARTVQTDAASIAAYNIRMYSEYRSDLKSQNELDVYGAKVLDYKKDAIQKFRATAIGQIDTRYVAQVVHVRAPDYGIFALTPYIIIQLHHILHKKSDVRGFDFITQYELVASDTQPIRVVRDNNPVEAMLLELYARLHALEAAKEDEDYWLGEVETGITTQIERGATFPLDQRDGDEFFLTADLTVGALEYYGPALYKYDDTAGDWVRNPIVLHRGAFPAVAGGYEEDTLYRTDTDTWYRFTGGAWTLIVISGTSLQKGIQPFDSAIFFEPIRAAATGLVTFNIDVNNGAGKAVITAAGGFPFSEFVVGDEVLIHNCEDPDNNTAALEVEAIGGGNTILRLNNVLAGTDTATDEQVIVSVMDGILWNGGFPALWFADGSNQNINAGSAHGMGTGANWVYFTVGNAVLTDTNTYANAVGDDVGVVCRLEIYNDQEPLIFPFYTRGGNISGDALAYGSVDTLVLTGEEIYGKHFATNYNVGEGLGSPAGVRFDRSGVYGYTGGGALMFRISALDGSAYFAGGDGVIDDTGLHLFGDQASFYTGAGAIVGTILGTIGSTFDVRAANTKTVQMINFPSTARVSVFDNGAIQISTGAGDDLDLALGGNLHMVSGWGILPPADHTADLGGPANTWRYFTPITNIAGRPGAVAGTVGLNWITREAGNNVSIMWVCMQNDDAIATYEWVELGRTIT